MVILHLRKAKYYLKKLLALTLVIFLNLSFVRVAAKPMTLTTITIDGNFSDWAAVKSDPDNLLADTVGDNDPDSNSQQNPNWTSDRDLTHFAFTWDNTYLYFYFRVSVFQARQTSFLVYIDKDYSNTLTNSDYLIDYQFNGSSFQNVGSGLYYYSAINPSGDQVTGDGECEPGARGAEILKPLSSGDGAGGGEGNLEKETRIAWSALGLPPGTPLRFHISTALNSSQLPNQVVDNAGPKSTLYAGVSVEPNRSASAPKGTVVTYTHTVQNTGNSTDTINLSATSSKGWQVGIYDASGDTTISSVTLAPNESTVITVKVTIPSNAQNGESDVTTVRGTSTVDSSKSDTATDTTTVGSITITPDNSGSMTTGTAISYYHTVANNTSATETVQLSATSSQGWDVVFKDASGSTTITSVVIGPNSSVGIIAQIFVPSGASIGDQDVTTVRAKSENDPSNQDEAKDITTVKKRVLIDPDNEGATGAGTTISYQHTITNSWNTTDTINLTYTNSHNWTVKIYDSGGINEISSVTLGPNGESTDIIVRVSVPIEVPIGTVNSTTIAAISASNPNYFDIAVDLTRVQQLITYKDAARTQVCTFFRLKNGSKVYARATNLIRNQVYKFRWIDASGNDVRLSGEMQPNADGILDDDYTMSGTETVGNWTLVLYRKSGNNFIEVTRTNFIVTYDAQIISLMATDAPNLNQDIFVDSTVTNNCEQTITNSIINYVIWWDSNGNEEFDAGDTYIGSDGNPYTWDGTSTVSTHETTGVNVPTGGTWSDPGWTISNSNFPYQGTYKITATWKTQSGLLIDEKTTSFFSIPTLGYPLLFALIGMGSYLLYRKREEVDFLFKRVVS